MRGVVQVEFGLLDDIEERNAPAPEVTQAAKHRNRQHLLDALARGGEIGLTPRAARHEFEDIKALPYLHAPFFEVRSHPVADRGP